ncbi:MAG TPA: S9 family peptidase [Verrucomicrobiae bacterium]|nr:S9 family peptidase [Verrucomicrobiae bacterium]
MSTPQVAPYGSWKSPITTGLIVAETIGLGQIALDGDDVYWIEGRPREGGRNVVVRNGSDVTPAPFNARTRVHEYGGGAFAVADGNLYFTNDNDQQLYRDTTPLTNVPGLRIADMIVDRQRLIAVCEDHRDSAREPINSLVAVSTGSVETLFAGHDFYSSPRLSPDGKRLAYLTWDHPNMPWDGTQLFVDGDKIAGGNTESIAQPEWSPDGELHFISDRTGWWNLYRWRNGNIEPLCPMDAEFTMPQWVFGMSSYAFIAVDRIVCAYNVKGSWRLALLDTRHGNLQPIPSPYTVISQVRANTNRIVFLGASPTEPESVVQFDLASRKFTTLRSSTNVRFESDYISSAEPIEFPTENGLTAHAFYYAPRNCEFAGPSKERPPLIVMIHGGPTSATTSRFDLAKQFWTSRGFAVVDVNYGGSTGYGRPYRGRLKGNWGIVDVDDCCNAARYLVERGDVDGARLIIRGGSAGGFTTLAALTFRDVFKAGASYFGISDLAASNDTHKFESRYNCSLIAPWPEGREVYRTRSPLFALDRLNCPIIFFQGLEDKVVLPNQSEMMVEAMRKKGLPVAYLAFEGEQHGFRRAETIKRTLEAELYFYSRVFGFPIADRVEPVRIENL